MGLTGIEVFSMGDSRMSHVCLFIFLLVRKVLWVWSQGTVPQVRERQDGNRKKPDELT